MIFLLSHILRLDLSTPTRKAMKKYFDALYIPSKGRPNHLGFSVKKRPSMYRNPTNFREDLEKLRMLVADKKLWKEHINN